MKKTQLILLFSVLISMWACNTKQPETTSAPVSPQADERPVLISAQIHIKPDSIEAFKRMSQEILHETRKEAGCVAYNLSQDIGNLGLFLFFEEYANKQAQTFHSEQPYLATFRQRREPLLQVPAKATIYTVSEKR